MRFESGEDWKISRPSQLTDGSGAIGAAAEAELASLAWQRAEKEATSSTTIIATTSSSSPPCASPSMFPSAPLLSRTTYRGASGSGAGRTASNVTSTRSSPDSRRTVAPSASIVFKRSQRGLYDGATLQSGNSTSDSRQKTKRTFRPNVQVKHLRSELLGRTVEVRTTSRALRTMQKKGGLDEYLATTKDWKLGQFGVDLRAEVASAFAAAAKRDGEGQR